MPGGCHGPKSLLSATLGGWGDGCVSLMVPPLSWYREEPPYQPDLLFLLQDEEFFLLYVKLGCVQHGLLGDKPHQLGPHHGEVQCLQRTSEM